MPELINSPMRKGIKVMAVTCQTARFISLMPKPQDFITRIVGDVVYLSAQVERLTQDINKVLDAYTDIPTNYIMTQVNSLTGSLTNLVSDVNRFTQDAVNQSMGIGTNFMDLGAEISGALVDISGSVTQAATSLGGAVVQGGMLLSGNFDKASDFQDFMEVTLEWTGEKFKEKRENAVAPFNSASKKMKDAQTKTTTGIDNFSKGVIDDINKPAQQLADLIKKLREMMDNLSKKIDGGFKGVTGLNSISKGASKVNEAIADSGMNDKYATATAAISSSIQSAINNFSIGKVVTAFAGVLTQTAIVQLGLDKLPPINVDMMLGEIRGEHKTSPEALSKRLNEVKEETKEYYNQYDKYLAEIGEVEYTAENYKKFKEKYKDDLKKQRDENIRAMKEQKALKKAAAKDEKAQKKAAEKAEREQEKTKLDKAISNLNDLEITDGMTDEEIESINQQRNELENRISAIKEARKLRRKAKMAKVSDKLLGSSKEELKRLVSEVKYKSKTIKADWESMLKTYKDAIKEITDFFTFGGSGDRYITDCCEKINEDCNNIVDICTGLSTQLIGCTIKSAMPADIVIGLGAAVPNPVYKIADFWMDIKTIFKFILDLIKLLIDILRNINNLAKVMLNGINAFSEIVMQLMDLIGLGWLMRLIQSIIDNFGAKILDVRLLLMNSLSPIHYNETNEYNNTMELLESLVGNDDDGADDTWKYLTSDNIKDLTDESRFYALDGIKNDIASDEKKYDELIEELEKKGDEIVAYKSPIIADIDESQKNTVDDLISGKKSNPDIKFIGWNFFHPNLNHTDFGKRYRKRKSKIIQKAAKTGNKIKGGINGMKSKAEGGYGKWKVKKYDNKSAYLAFYWYTYYTEDLEKDCFEWETPQDATKIDSVVRTENGSIVELDDGRKVFVANNNVRSGDYVTVDGVKYRVR